jgi:hypothetical protein
MRPALKDWAKDFVDPKANKAPTNKTNKTLFIINSVFKPGPSILRLHSATAGSEALD